MPLWADNADGTGEYELGNVFVDNADGTGEYEIGKIYANDQDGNGEYLIYEDIIVVDDFTHGDVSNYPASLLYGTPYQDHYITTSGVTNDDGYALHWSAVDDSGGFSSMPGDNTPINYHPDVGDTIRCTGYLDPFYTSQGSDKVWYVFGQTQNDDKDKGLFVEYHWGQGELRLWEGWSSGATKLAGKKIYSSSSEPAAGNYWIDCDWQSGSMTCTLNHETDGELGSISGSYSETKGRGVGFAGDKYSSSYENRTLMLEVI